MPDKSLIFQAESIHGIQRFLRGEPGAKSVTRRIMKPQPASGATWAVQQPDRGWNFYGPKDEFGRALLFNWCKNAKCDPITSPIHAGDWVRVKEAFAWPGEEEIFYRAEPEHVRVVEHFQEKWRADKNYPEIKWTSPMFMPRLASRYWLHASSVRAERLQDITEEDAIREGCKAVPSLRWGAGLKPMNDGTRERQDFRGSPPEGWTAIEWSNSDYDPCAKTARQAFRDLFDSINGKGSWERNPWVWRIEWDQVATEESRT